MALLPGCSTEARDRLRAVDIGAVRLDTPAPRPQRRVPPAAEQRRRGVLAGADAALLGLAGVVTGPGSPLASGLDAAAAIQVHEEHIRLLGGRADPGPFADLRTTRTHATGNPSTDMNGPCSDLPAPAGPGPVLSDPGSVARAVLGAGLSSALAAGVAELDDDPRIAVLYARMAAARGAQAAALDAPVTWRSPWPAQAAGPVLTDAAVALLAVEHAAIWSLRVVEAWSGDPAAVVAVRLRHEQERELLVAALEAHQVRPPAPSPTYDTTVEGQAVADAGTAGALALRVQDEVCARVLDVLVAAVQERRSDWLGAAVGRLADAERSRWSAGGVVVPLPGR